MKFIPNVIKTSKIFMIILLFTLSYTGSANMIEKKKTIMLILVI